MRLFRESIMMPTVIAATTVAFVALCVVVDVRSRRIPNAISAPGMLLGIALNTAYRGGAGVVASLSGLVLTVGVLLWPFAMGGIGGGDVKMMGAVGALLGPRIALMGLCLGMIMGGGLMVWHLARRGRLREKVTATATMFQAAAITRSLDPLRVSAADPGAIALPYSVSLGLGTLAALTFSGRLGL
jgi:prepilin peptidase CpaA